MAVGASKQEGWNPCAEQNGYCSHLCLYRGTHGYICACPDLPTPHCNTGNCKDIDNHYFSKLMAYYWQKSKIKIEYRSCPFDNTL